MARKTNKAQVLELAAQLGVEVEYGPMGDDGFEVALYDYAGHMARSTPWARVTPPSPTADCHCRGTAWPKMPRVTFTDMTHKTGVLYIAGWNMPGYLPESDPAIFDNETDAIRYLSDTVDRFWSEDDEADNNPPRHAGQAGKWSDVYANLPFETAPFNIANNDRSLTFWVTVVPKSDLPYITGGN